MAGGIDLVDLLNNTLVSDNGRPSIEKETTLRPTEASVCYASPSGRQVIEGSCLRKIYYRLTGEKRTNPPADRLHWVWWAGKSYEDKCTELLRESGQLAMDNPRFVYKYPELPFILSGEFDAVGKDPDTGDYYIIEFKSTGGSYQGRTGLMGSARKTPAPKTDNLLQLILYLDRTFDSVSYGILCYLIRDKMELAQFWVKLKEENGDRVPYLVHHKQNFRDAVALPQYSVNNILARYKTACDYILSKTCPPRDYALEYSDEQATLLLQDGELSKIQYNKHISGEKRMGDWRCAFCDYEDLCWKETE